MTAPKEYRALFRGGSSLLGFWKLASEIPGACPQVRTADLLGSLGAGQRVGSTYT